ncbi:unnamed protein product [Calypogeia fissa]
MQYRGEDMEAFGAQYRDAIDRCVKASLHIDPIIQALHFILVLDGPHFDHWSANKREHMRHSDYLPSLDFLIHEAIDEWHSRRLERKRAALQLNLTSSTTAVSRPSNPPPRKDVCPYCRLPNHKETTCYYKHVHFRRPGWQPNTVTLQKIDARLQGNSNAALVNSPPLDLFNFVQFSHQVHSEASPEISTDT